MKECARVFSKFIEFSLLRFLFRHKSRFQHRWMQTQKFFVSMLKASHHSDSSQRFEWHLISIAIWATWDRMIFITQFLYFLQLKRVLIQKFWLHQRNIIETRSIKCLDNYWRRTSRENIISSFYRSQIVIIKRDTQCEFTENF